MPNSTYHHGDLKNALIKAGIEILSKEGANALSLRKVAQRAGVSHAAPYAHFADKQALIAAISTEGFNRINEKLEEAIQSHQGDPLRQLVEIAWAYTRFAMEDPDHFKITLSGVLEKGKEYPAFVAVSKKGFGMVEQVVADCQKAGVLGPGPTDAVAVSVWSLVHGFVSLLLESQISHTLTERMNARQMLIFALGRITIKEITFD
jgi:AcrR family transcriptional regulator